MKKLYLVTRADLTPGARAAQLCHALRAFVDEHPQEDQSWFTQSNTLVLLETSDETALARLVERAQRVGVPVSTFREPDLGDALTAIAVAPTGKRLCSGLRLAFAAA